MKRLQIMLVAIIILSIANLLISNSEAQEDWKACSITQLLELSSTIDAFNEKAESWNPDDPESFLLDPIKESDVVEDLPFCRESVMFALVVTNGYSRAYLLSLLNNPLPVTMKRQHIEHNESLAVSEVLWGAKWFGFGDLLD